jgi:hypothetical protein
MRRKCWPRRNCRTRPLALLNRGTARLCDNQLGAQQTACWPSSDQPPSLRTSRLSCKVFWLLGDGSAGRVLAGLPDSLSWDLAEKHVEAGAPQRQTASGEAGNDCILAPQQRGTIGIFPSSAQQRRRLGGFALLRTKSHWCSAAPSPRCSGQTAPASDRPATNNRTSRQSGGGLAL